MKRRDDEEVTINIDFGGLEGRVVALQDSGGNYDSLSASPNGPCLCIRPERRRHGHAV